MKTNRKEKEEKPRPSWNDTIPRVLVPKLEIAREPKSNWGLLQRENCGNPRFLFFLTNYSVFVFVFIRLDFRC